MTDIVERLRGKLPMEHDGEGMIVDDDAVLDMFEAAADEIERLRAACENASSYISVRDQFAMAALTGLLSVSSTIGTREGYCKAAYEYADAMMKAREGKQ